MADTKYRFVGSSAPGQGFHAVPDSDHEFNLYLCADGKGELWGLLGPGIPRMHDFPGQGKRSRGIAWPAGAGYNARLSRP